MKGLRFLKEVALGMTCGACMLAPVDLLAAGLFQHVESAKPIEAATVTDVEMNKNNTVIGQVVDSKGLGIDGAVISLKQGNREILQTVTDKNGRFAVTNLRGGLYQVSAGQESRLFRFWTSQTAPPTAQPVARIVSSEIVYPSGQLVRAQGGLIPIVGGVDAVSAATIGGVGLTTGVSVINNNELSDLEEMILKLPLSP